MIAQRNRNRQKAKARNVDSACYIQQAMALLPKLTEREQRVVAEHIKVLADRG